MSIEADLENKIIEFLKEKVLFAYLFGSAVGKYYTNDSDLDIAVWLKDKPANHLVGVELKNQLEKKIEYKRNIDLIILNLSDIIITNQVITKGKLIINNDAVFLDKFIISRLSMYFDFKIFRKNLEDNLKSRVI